MKQSFRPAVSLAAAAVALAVSAGASAQVTFYQSDNFQGFNATVSRPVEDLSRVGFNDQTSSMVVQSGSWEVCEHAGFNGRCMIFRPGNYPNLSSMGMNDRISSVRPVGANVVRTIEPSRYGPEPMPEYRYVRRSGERLFQVPVTSVRAIFGEPEQRCWVERREYTQNYGTTYSGDTNPAGAIIGGIIGGVLGHQFGSGRGNDAATVGGAIAGAAIGSQAGTSGYNTYQNQYVVPRNVQRCRNVPSATPAFWEVTYRHRGVEHRAQLASQPGPTITVNRQGEPRM